MVDQKPRGRMAELESLRDRCKEVGQAFRAKVNYIDFVIENPAAPKLGLIREIAALRGELPNLAEVYSNYIIELEENDYYGNLSLVEEVEKELFSFRPVLTAAEHRAINSIRDYWAGRAEDRGLSDLQASQDLDLTAGVHPAEVESTGGEQREVASQAAELTSDTVDTPAEEKSAGEVADTATEQQGTASVPVGEAAVAMETFQEGRSMTGPALSLTQMEGGEEIADQSAIPVGVVPGSEFTGSGGADGAARDESTVAVDVRPAQQGVGNEAIVAVVSTCDPTDEAVGATDATDEAVGEGEPAESGPQTSVMPEGVATSCSHSAVVITEETGSGCEEDILGQAPWSCQSDGRGCELSESSEPFASGGEGSEVSPETNAAPARGIKRKRHNPRPARGPITVGGPWGSFELSRWLSMPKSERQFLSGIFKVDVKKKVRKKDYLAAHFCGSWQDVARLLVPKKGNILTIASQQSGDEVLNAKERTDVNCE